LVILLVLNWIFGGWFLNTLFSSEWRNLWTPRKMVAVPQGLLLAFLLTVGSFVGIGLSVLIQEYMLQNHTGSGPMINPPFMIPGLFGLAALVGGSILMLRYMYIFGLFGYFAVMGTKVNFVDRSSDAHLDYPVTRVQVENLNFGLVGPDTRDEVLDHFSTSGGFKSGDNIPKGVLFIGNLGENWSSYPVRALVISFTGGSGIFESLDSFTIQTDRYLQGRYTKIEDNQSSTVVPTPLADDDFIAITEPSPTPEP
jgi:hypothetical protein